MKTIRLFFFAAAMSVSAALSAQTYEVGDYYPDPDVNVDDASAAAKVEGIVFEVSEDGKHGKIFSLKEGSGLKWSEIGGADYTDDENDGQMNYDIIKVLEPEFNGYPAFQWAASLGEGWYLPAINELVVLREAWGTTNAKRKALNKKIEAVGGTPLSNSVYVSSKGANASAVYYSSTENPQKRNKIMSLSFNSFSDPADGVKKLSNSAENLLFRAVKTF